MSILAARTTKNGITGSVKMTPTHGLEGLTFCV